MAADLFRSEAPGNQGGTGRSGPPQSQHSRHVHCRSPVRKSLQTSPSKYQHELWNSSGMTAEEELYLSSRQFPSSCGSSHCSTWPCPRPSWCKLPHSPDPQCHLALLVPSPEHPWAPSGQSHPWATPRRLSGRQSSSTWSWKVACHWESPSPPCSACRPWRWSADGTTGWPQATFGLGWCCSYKSMPVLHSGCSGLKGGHGETADRWSTNATHTPECAHLPWTMKMSVAMSMPGPTESWCITYWLPPVNHSISSRHTLWFDQWRKTTSSQTPRGVKQQAIFFRNICVAQLPPRKCSAATPLNTIHTFTQTHTCASTLHTPPLKRTKSIYSLIGCFNIMQTLMIDPIQFNIHWAT